MEALNLSKVIIIQHLISCSGNDEGERHSEYSLGGVAECLQFTIMKILRITNTDH